MPRTQNELLLAHLLGGRTITRIQADHLYRIAALPRRIADLKEKGHNIVAVDKYDATGRRYTEYSLVTRNRFGQKVAA